MDNIMEITIEIPRIEEQKEINELAKQVHKLHVNWRPDLFLDVEEVIPKDRLKDLLDDKSIYVAKFEGRLVGYIIIDIIEKKNNFMRYRKLLEIDTLCIDENYRGKGIGTKLLEFAKELGRKNQCTDIYLTVSPENENAIKVYESFGMRVKGISYMKEIKDN